MLMRRFVAPRKSGQLGSVAGSVVEYVIALSLTWYYCYWRIYRALIRRGIELTSRVTLTEQL
jgi:hypothetical protein